MSGLNDTGAYANIIAGLDAFVPNIDPVNLPGGYSIDILRLDEIHPYISGNKWYKLKYNLAAANQQAAHTLISFGGAYSNHLVAVSEAARLTGMGCVCIIRGEEPALYNPRLNFIKSTGATLHFVSRTDYRLKEKSDTIRKIIEAYTGYYLIPEGGANELGVKGSAEILRDVSTVYDIIACAAGTGTMAAGIIQSANPHSLVYVFPAIKLGGTSYTETALCNYISQYTDKTKSRYQFILGYDFGGYAHTQPALDTFISQFTESTSINLDSVYTAKMLYGITDMFSNGLIGSTKRVLAIHSGGVFPG